ncbi:MAG: polysaccharide pyruvyl transferase family protein [Prevotella sp.]|nr:polysaccharide pyruvyl transferase family protein [Prevotella sp.]
MNGLLICSGEFNRKNIGDYIQSLAQEQFFDKIDCFVERERINTFEAKEKVNLIMNAWWMWHPENFPPSKCINPLFISFHIVPSIAKQMLTPAVVNYLKKYEPIGARDIGTKDLLESYGIKSYFSGCLTLTLGLKYKSNNHDNTILFVDPYYELGCTTLNNWYIKILKSFGLLIKHLHKVLRLKKRFVFEFKSPLSYHHFVWLDRWLMCASFYEAYSKAFSDEVLFNAEYLSHDIDQADFIDDRDKLAYARNLMYKYGKAKYVVTSRIHCGLPCLGIETSVLFVSSDKLEGNTIRSSGRFGGLIELFHVMRFTDKGIVGQSEYVKKQLKNSKFDMDTSFNNKSNYIKLRDKMECIVNQFVDKYSGG